MIRISSSPVLRQFVNATYQNVLDGLFVLNLVHVCNSRFMVVSVYCLPAAFLF